MLRSPLPRPLRLTRAALAAGLLLGAGMMTGAAQTMPDGRPTPTGLEVPRWITLKSDRVRARQGPGLDHAVMWEYRAAGLPVQVIAETREWRKICDPEGSVAWIHRTVASGRRTVFNRTGAEVVLRAGRSERAASRGALGPRAIAPLDDCRDGWCRIGGRGARGWVEAGQVFGVQDRALCDYRRAAGRANRAFSRARAPLPPA